jgi:hypothetical protein
MILKRKDKAPLMTDVFGVQHPHIVAAVIDVRGSKKNKFLTIECGYFHSLAAKEMGFQHLGGVTFSFNFNMGREENHELDSKGNVVRLGWPNYDTIMQDITTDEEGELVFLNEKAEYWFLNQDYIPDIEGNKFGENWEFAG